MNRISLLSRVMAGTFGTYAVTVLVTIALSRLLIAAGADPLEATLGATLASFAIFAGVSIAIFHAARPWLAWLWLALGSIALAAIILAFPATA